MDLILGGGQGENYFIELLLRGLLAVREKAQNLISIIKLTSNSEYQCYRPDSIEKVYKRLMLDVPTKMAILAFKKQIRKAKSSFKTKTYD